MRIPITLLAEQDVSLFLGEDLITYLVLAFGGALFVGNLAAILRPPTRDDDGARRDRRPAGSGSRRDRARADAGDDDADEPLESAPIGRSLVMAGIGFVAAVWAIASLVRG